MIFHSRRQGKAQGLSCSMEDSLFILKLSSFSFLSRRSNSSCNFSSFLLFYSSILCKFCKSRLRVFSSFSKLLIFSFCLIVSSERVVRVAAMICLSAQKLSKLICSISDGERLILLNSFANSIHLRDSSGSPRSDERKFLRTEQICALLKCVSSLFQKLDCVIIKLQPALPAYFIIQMARIKPTLALLLLSSLYVSALGAITCPISNSPSVKIGNNAAICLVVQYTNTTNTYQQYYVFRIKIDQFTSLKLNGLSALLKGSQATKATLTIQFQNEATGTDFPILLNNTNSTLLQRSVISAVINTLNGGFSSIANDNFCDSNCGTCYKGDCYDNFNNYGSPDLKVYVSWAGSDSKNDQYLSQSQRLSRFNLYSVSSLYSSVKDIAIN